MEKKKALIVAVLAVAIVTLFALLSAGGDPRPALLGTWTVEGGMNMSITFTEDGMMSVTLMDQKNEGAYSVEGNAVLWTREGNTRRIPFVLEEDVLTLTMNGQPMKLTRDGAPQASPS